MHARRQLFANAAIAASRVGLYPYHSKTHVQKMRTHRVTAVTPAEIAGRTNLLDETRRIEGLQELAERCVEIASECSAPTVAEALRALAVDYLARAAKLRGAKQSSRQGRRPKRLADERN